MKCVSPRNYMNTGAVRVWCLLGQSLKVHISHCNVRIIHPEASTGSPQQIEP